MEFAEFQAANTESTITEQDGKYIISKPWGDESFELIANPEDIDLKATLNQVYQPPRFYAVWHRDTNDFEIIYSPVRRESLHFDL